MAAWLLWMDLAGKAMALDGSGWKNDDSGWIWRGRRQGSGGSSGSAWQQGDSGLIWLH
jgi:hypothetical protein